MTPEQMIADLKTRTGETSDEVLTSYLAQAGAAIIEKAFPFEDDVETVPPKYHRRQIEIAEYLYLKQGAQGETKHDENGINRSYESGSIPKSMLDGIMPLGWVPKETIDEDA